ncbi:hypothetical protein NBE98_15880 [Clostridium swellfunianum]|uniref:hypothetical protein n=1 Tax=Clostridium swellfunianum TaxID=1367462 RepID=UPI00202DE20E|nr:hypothetical protein [Clostridium swellfunianum]MCM0649846.1 hypothetical protein [Clostridium swellfunianum]
MSKKCCKENYCENKGTFLGLGNCCCDFPTLIILILIILQFNKKGNWGFSAPVAQAVDECGNSAPVAPGNFFGGHNLIDNSILFIIALYFLSCCNPCRK